MSTLNSPTFLSSITIYPIKTPWSTIFCYQRPTNTIRSLCLYFLRCHQRPQHI